MKVGFTGTRGSMTMSQSMTFERVMRALQPTAFHHGDCVGADAQAATWVVSSTLIRIVAHPANMTGQRAFTIAHEHRPVMLPLDRNRDIVRETDLMIATPGQRLELKRGSGTWATIRFARKMQRPLIIIWPQGDAVIENLTAVQAAVLNDVARG